MALLSLGFLFCEVSSTSQGEMMQEERGTWTLILETPIKKKNLGEGLDLGLLGRGPFLPRFSRYAPPAPSAPVPLRAGGVK